MHAEFGNHYVTDQVLAQASILRSLDDVPMKVRGERILRDMIESLDAGVRQCPSEPLRRVREVDPNLQLRWDFAFNLWVLDRWVEEKKCFMTVTQLGPSLTFNDVSELIDLLKAGDMQRFSTPEEYQRAKRQRAEAVQAANQKKGEAKVLAAVDKLSDASVKQFIQVERALRTGERVFSTGEDAKKLEIMARAGKDAPAPPAASDAMNPGMHPNVYRRKRRK